MTLGRSTEGLTLEVVSVPNCSKKHSHLLRGPRGSGGSGVYNASVPFSEARSGVQYPFTMRPASRPALGVDLQEWKATKMPCIKPAPLKDTKIYGPASCLVLDYDGAAALSESDVVAVQAALRDHGLAYSMWESVTSRRDGQPVKLHVLVPVSGAPVPPEAYKQAALSLAEALGLGAPDPQVLRVEQPVAIPLREEAPLDDWFPGASWHVTPEQVARWSVAGQADRHREDTRRQLEDQGPVLQDFNTRVAAGGLHLLDEYQELTGCRFVPQGPGWVWEAVADSPHGLYRKGDRASGPTIRRTTDDDYRFTDFGNGPLGGRDGGPTSLFPHEVLIRQVAWHAYGLDRLDDWEWERVKGFLLERVLGPQSRGDVEGMFATSGTPARGAGAGAGELPALEKSLYDAVTAQAYVDKNGNLNFSRCCKLTYAGEAQKFSTVLQDVVRDPSGVVYRIRGGVRTVLAGKEAVDQLLADVVLEVAEGAPEGVYLSPGADFVRQMYRARLADPASLVEAPQAEFLRRCASSWEEAGRPEPESLFGGVVPGMADQGAFTRAAWRRLLLIVAEVGLFPGTEYGKNLYFLVGESNAGKSQFVEALAGKHVPGAPAHIHRVQDHTLFTGLEGTRGSAIVACSQSLVVELGEMQAALTGGDVSRALKTFLTQNEYTVTPKFLSTVTLPRSFVLVGTANNGDHGGLIPTDEGSDRRYTVLEMVADPTTEAYRALSRLVSPQAVASGEAGRLEGLMLGWAAAQVLAAHEAGGAAVHDLLDKDFSTDGRLFDAMVRSQYPYLSHTELRDALLRCPKGVSRDGRYYLTLSALREDAGLKHELKGAYLNALIKHARALGGGTKDSRIGMMVWVPESAREGVDDEAERLFLEAQAAAARI